MTALPRLHREAVLAQVRNLNCLPAWPQILDEIEAEITGRDPTVARVARLIEQDASLAAGVLRLANSAMFHTGTEVRTVLQAAMRLGLEEVRKVVMATALVSRYADVGQHDLRRFWIHALAVAATTQALAELAAPRLSDEEIHAAFVAGLLHDLGAMVLRVLYPDESEALAEHLRATGGVEAELQREAWGIDYCEIGAALAARWQLPTAVQQAVRWHLAPWQAVAPHRDLVRLVHLADFGCVNQGYGRGDEGFPEAFDEGAWAELGMRVEDIPRILEQVVDGGQQSKDVLRLVLAAAPAG